MFGRFFGKKRRSTQQEDQWSVATAQDGDKTVIFRIRAIPANLNRANYPKLIAVAWPYEARAGGMPSHEDTLRMALLEDTLMPVLENAGNAILTMVATGNGVREWQWYSQSDTDTMDLVNFALKDQEVFPVEFIVQDDPHWEAFTRFEESQ